MSTISTAFGPPPFTAQRDIMAATQDWRDQREEERRDRGVHKPGVTFNVPDDPPDIELEAKLTRAASRRRVRRPSNDSSAEQ